MQCISAFVYGNGADENRRRHSAVDVAVVLVDTFLIGRESGDAGGVGGLHNGVKVEPDGIARLVAEVGEVECDAVGLSLNAGDKLANLHIEFYGVDMHDIVGSGMAGTQAGVEL